MIIYDLLEAFHVEPKKVYDKLVNALKKSKNIYPPYDYQKYINDKCLYYGDLEKKKIAKQLSERINNKIFEVKKLVTENKDLYGSIKPTEISKIILKNEDLEIKPSMMQLSKEIKSLGDFKVKIDLHSQVQAVIDIKVIAEEITH